MSLENLKVHSAALALLAALSAAVPAGAAVFLPTTTNDTADGICDAECSLRDAISEANKSAGFDVIVLGPGVYRASGSGNEDLNAGGDFDILDDLGVRPAEAVMIGDTTFDLEMANNAGAGGIGVCSGSHGREDLLRLEPLACLERVVELPGWLAASREPAPADS